MSPNLESAADLVRFLPEEFKDNFTLVHASGSLRRECYSTRYPRVILFSHTNQMVVTFGGTPNDPNCAGAEVLALSDTNQWTYADLAFKGGSATPKESCISCHSTSFRPIWKDYDTWEGTYGRKDDTFDPDSQEAKDFLEVKSSLRHDKGYQLLNWGNQETEPFYPYGTVYRGSLEHRPNTRLGILLKTMQAKHISEKLFSKSPYRYSYAAKELYCSALPDSLYEGIPLDSPIWKELQDLSALAPRKVITQLQSKPNSNFSIPDSIDGYTQNFNDGSRRLFSSTRHQVYQDAIRSIPALENYPLHRPRYQDNPDKIYQNMVRHRGWLDYMNQSELLSHNPNGAWHYGPICTEFAKRFPKK